MYTEPPYTLYFPPSPHHTHPLCLLFQSIIIKLQRCDRAVSLGLNLANMGKILKCAGNEDIVTLKSQEEGDMLNVMFESPNQVSHSQIQNINIDTKFETKLTNVSPVFVFV